eukprot:8647065-Pyramimonas_sp.AAC.1
MAVAGSCQPWPCGRCNEGLGRYKVVESRRGRARNGLGHEKDQGGKGSQWKRARIDCELGPRQEEWGEWSDEEKTLYGVAGIFRESRSSDNRRGKHMEPRGQANPRGKIRAAQALLAEEEGPTT